jgi:SAM-dependent methyltransferase
MLVDLKECQLCGGNDFARLDLRVPDDVFAKENPEAQAVNWCLCTGCSYLFQSPRRSLKDQVSYYEVSGYRKPTPNPISEGYIRYAPMQFARFGHWLAMCGIDIQNMRGLTCLDYGCGIGGALHFLGANGNTVYGVELDDTLAAYGNGHYAVKILPRTENLPPEAAFDLIFTHHSLEHVYDPNDFFAFAARRLKPNGVLVNVVPTWRYSNTSESRNEFNSSHNTMFDHVSFSAFLNKYGFFMESHLYHNQAPDGDWELCSVARKSGRKNYFGFEVGDIVQELFKNIQKREAERKRSSGGPENIAVIST